MLCMMAIGANAQTTINGTAGTLNGPGGTIKDIKAAEQSPANIRYKGETKIVDQFFAICIIIVIDKFTCDIEALYRNLADLSG